MTRLNIALVQYDPRFRDVQGNMQRVDKMIARLTPELVDILLLPEMAFTGYMFASRVEIDPFLESEDGPSISWAQRTAKRLQATILVGYPERDRISGNAFNSIAVVDYEGRLQVRSRNLACRVKSLPSLHRRYTGNTFFTTPTRAGVQKVLHFKPSMYG